MYTVSLNETINSKARLISSYQNKTAGSCIHFFYYTIGNIDQYITYFLSNH
jgi:hypothetical protein